MADPVDHAHTARAERNRARKATALAAAAAASGLVVVELQHGSDDTHAARRRSVEKTAGLTRAASQETWAAALADLEQQLRAVDGTGPCVQCGSPVRWALTQGGKTVSVDPLPHPDGRLLPKRTPHGVRVKVLAGHDEIPPGDDLWRDHTTSCPAARRPPPAPRCAECGRGLDRVLAEDIRAETHPGCDPRPGPDEDTPTLADYLARTTTPAAAA